MAWSSTNHTHTLVFSFKVYKLAPVRPKQLVSFGSVSRKEHLCKTHDALTLTFILHVWAKGRRTRRRNDASE